MTPKGRDNTFPKANGKTKKVNNTTAESLPQKRLGIFTTFRENPVGAKFQTQEPDEEIILFLRKHLITNLPWIFISFLLIIFPILLSIFVNLESLSPFSAIPASFLIVFTAFYYLIVFGYIIVSFTTWFFNVSLVTTERIVDIDYFDIVVHSMATTKLDLVEDVEYTQSGFIRSLFNYGDVFVQTAGEKPNFHFLSVPKPAKAVDIIGDLIGEGENVS